MSSLTVEEDQRWVPTHVQVTVLKGRGLRGKGKHGTSDVYTIIQLGKEKYSTGVAEKTTEPEWREECSFELQPGVLENAERSGYPAGSNELVLTVMHRALIGLDVFLGQAVIQLDKLFHERRHVKNDYSHEFETKGEPTALLLVTLWWPIASRWYRLNSKTGKKEKERGDIQVTILFTRNNLTASMYDLVMKDKGASTFSKLKERMKGKRRSSDEESSSAVVPGGYSSLYRMRQRLPSDGGGEEDYEDDEGGEVRRSKMRTFFLRGKLRKSSDTRSSTSLGSESSESSSRGGSLSPTAGISVVVSDLSNSPSNSSNFTADNSPEHTANISPKSSSLRCEFGDDAGEITIAVPPPTVCVNGSHASKVQAQDRGSGKPSGSLGSGLLLQRSVAHSVSLQNLSTKPSAELPKGPAGDGRRWSFDRAGEEERAAIAAALGQSGAGEEERPEPASLPDASQAEPESQVKKQRRNLFSHGRSESAGKGQSQSKGESEQSAAATEDKHRAWFGSKDSHNKPSLVVSTKLEPSTDPHPPPLPLSRHPPGVPGDPTSLVSALHHTNPFSRSQTTPPPISQCNPFYSRLQHNPFFTEMLTNQTLKSPLPPLPYLSSSRPPITDLFPQSSNPDLMQDSPTVEDTADAKDQPVERPLPPVPLVNKEPLIKKLSNPFLSAEERNLDLEWDESFEAFAAGRLQSPEEFAMESRTQQNTVDDHPLEHDRSKGELQPVPDANEQTNISDVLYDQPGGRFLSNELPLPIQMRNNNALHFDAFPQFLETIPEHRSFDSDDSTLNTPTNSPEPTDFIVTEQDSNTTNDFTHTNINAAPFHISSAQLNNNSSSSPDPSSSGLGSSTEEDVLSCFSSQSEKFSVSSSEEAESTILHFKNSSDSTAVKTIKTSGSGDGIADKSVDQFLIADSHKTVDQPEDSHAEMVGWNFLGDPFQPLSLTTSEKETESEPGGSQTPKTPDLNPDLLQTLQPTSVVCQQSSNDGEEESKDCAVDPSEDFSARSKNSATEELMPASSDDEFSSTLPSVPVIASSPEVKQDLLDVTNENTGSEAQKVRPYSHVEFGIFDEYLNVSHLASSRSQDFDTAWLNIQTPEQSSNTLRHSHYFSADSQDYLTCDSHSFSNGSVLNETLFSANSTCSGEMSNVQAVPDDLFGMGHTNLSQSSNFEVNQNEIFGEFLQFHQGNLVNVETSLTGGDGLQVLPAPLPDRSSNTKIHSDIGEGNQNDIFLQSPQGQHAALQRSLSEGTLAPAFDQLFPSSFGSDPCAIQESSFAQLDPVFPFPNTFAPSLIPESSSFHVAFSALSPLATISATEPPGSEPGATPQPDVTKRRQAANQPSSPHPVKPLTTAMLAEEKRSVLATGLEKLKSTIHPGRSSQIAEQEADRKKALTEGAGSYYHLTHSELVALLVQREAELEGQRAEFERQKLLLAKREVELKKLKPQVRDLEDYIDTLLVRIMEQKPTLLQVRPKFK
ncbi:dentin sialophosphoprotein isoform X1 [Xiphophorus hellerii]|uniref:dentin sialophosphoprotein isoform X1 n=1 Tax=Xiphophorus hellerii TaxID=8084 RepID=UPI0013B4085C|nr:dentin sialophosphoprotein-like isoform X1 [Xiphophorus hellerii]